MGTALSLSASDLQGQGTVMPKGFISTSRAAFPAQHFQEGPGTLWEYLVWSWMEFQPPQEGIWDRGAEFGG